MKATTPRGIRNYNPGNLDRVAGVRWQGQAEQQTDARFVQFVDPRWGIRAIARTLITYQDKRRAQPYGEGSPLHAYIQIYDLIADHTPSLVNAPAFMNTKHKVYGPIFIGAWGGHADAEDMQITLKVSEQLPPWFYIYSPGFAGVAPRSIMHQGKQHLFVEP